MVNQGDKVTYSKAARKSLGDAISNPGRKGTVAQVQQITLPSGKPTWVADVVWASGVLEVLNVKWLVQQ